MMTTLFVLEDVNGIFAPDVYAIPLDKQIEVENIAKGITNVNDPEEVFQQKLDEKGIEYEWVGMICNNFIKNEKKQTNWINDKISRVVAG